MLLYPLPEPITAKFRLDLFILSPLNGETPQKNFLPHFQIRRHVVAPSNGVQTKLNMDAQLQTFPYPTISKHL